MNAAIALSWLLNYLLHSSLLLALAWTVDRPGWLPGLRQREWLWRLALCGGLLSASVATARACWPQLRPPLQALLQPAIEDAPRAGFLAPGSLAAPLPPVAAAPTDAPRPVQGDAPAPIAAATLAPGLARTLLLAWAAVAVPGVLLLALQLLVLQRRARRLPLLDDPELQQLCRKLAPQPVRLQLSCSAASPAAGPGRCITLPQWLLQQASPVQRRALLAHELAHLQRRDPQWRLAIVLLRRLCWLQPLNRLAQRRLEVLAELACDRWAARHTGAGRALAESLLQCAERVQRQVRCRTSETLLPAMAQRHSPLLVRVKSLLEPAPMHESKPHSLSLCAAAVACCVASLLLPGLAISETEYERAAGSPVATAPDPASGSDMLVQDDSRERSRVSIRHVESLFGSHLSVKVGQGSQRLQAWFDGRPRFDPAGTQLVELKGGDEAWIEEQRDGVKRRLDWEEQDGELRQRYRVDGVEQPFDAAAQQWLGAALATVLRETALDAEARVAGLLRRGGSAAVLAEIDRINGHYARRVYLVELVEQATLAAAELPRYIAAAAAIDGDYERRVALVALLKRQALDASAQVRLLAATARIGSDYEQRLVLNALAARLQVADPAVQQAWGQAVGELKSGYERRLAIVAVAERRELPDAMLDVLLAATSGIGSDYEARVALAELAPRLGRSGRMAQHYANATRRIESDYEQRQALSALLDGGALERSAYPAVLDASSSIGSDYERRLVLTEMARHLPADGELVAQYRAAARELGDYERLQAEKALDRLAL